jgi:hypothetical protein
MYEKKKIEEHHIDGTHFTFNFSLHYVAFPSFFLREISDTFQCSLDAALCLPCFMPLGEILHVNAPKKSKYSIEKSLYDIKVVHIFHLPSVLKLRDFHDMTKKQHEKVDNVDCEIN